MSDNEPDEIDVDELREAAKGGSQAKADLAATQRELALVKAGIDTDSPVGKMFAKAYDGELNTDAIKAAALEVGAIQTAPEPTPVVLVDPAEVAQTQERANLAAGAQPSNFDPSAVNPRQQGWENYRNEIQGGATDEIAAAGYLGPLLTAAANGDPRALFNRQRWLAENGGNEE